MHSIGTGQRRVVAKECPWPVHVQLFFIRRVRSQMPA